MKLTEAYIKGNKGNVYYTKNNELFLEMVKNIFISKNKAVRVYYDFIKQIYVFGDAFNYIHTELATEMKYHSKVYGIDEMKYNVSYVMKNCALFQVLPNDNFKEYDVGDGYTKGRFLILDGLIFACREKEYKKVRDNVPLFNGHIGEWQDVQYYEYKKSQQTVNESYGRMDRPFIWNDPTYSQFHRILRDNTTYGKLSAIIDNGHIYCWDSALSHHDSVVKDIEESGIKLSDDYIWVRFKEPNLCWVSAAYFDDYTDEDLEDLPQQDFEKELEDNPIIRKYFPQGVKIVRFDRINESVEDNFNSKNNCKIVLKDGKTIYGHLLSVNENYVYINSNNGNRIKKDGIKELYMYYDCEVITKNGKTIYGNFVGDFGDHKLHLDDSFNKKGWTIKDEMIEKVNYKKVIKHTFDTDTLNESVNNKPKLITAYRGIDSDKFKFKNGTPQWFSSSEGIAKSFGDITFEVKLKLNNPADLTNDKELYIILKDMIKEYEESYRSRYNQIRGYLVDYIKETYPDFDISDIDDNTLISLSKKLKDDDNTLIRLSKKLKDAPYNIEHNIILFKELCFMLNDISKNIAWAGFFHVFIYPNWDRVIKTVQEQGYDSIISYEEASNRSYIDIGYVIWNNENIVSIKKLSKNINESVEDKILYIIRGVPGSGKSTLAHKLTDNVVEADQYFYDDKGNYNWSADKLHQAHNWCYNTVKKYMEEGRDKIAVANTFVKNRDYKRYVELAKEFGYKVDIRTCTGNYQNIHNVPDETVEKMRSKFQETPLDESVKLVNKELSDTKLITTPFEMNNYLKNNNETRFVYDTEKKWYLVGDAENSIHINLLNDALADGYYEPFEYNGKIINADSADLDAKAGKLLYQTNPNRFLLFRTSSDQLNGEDYYYDRYKYCYVYNNYCIFSRDINFEKTSLYKVLGKPNELEFIGDIDEDEGLNESIAYASKKDLSDIILKNPTRKELKDNGLEFCRYMFEDDNTYYFADAKEYSHLDISQLFLDIFKNYNLHTDGGYYSVKENCFYIRNDFGCEKNKERLDNTKLLHKLFGNFKSIIYEGDYPEGYSKELDESAENDRTLRDYAVKLAIICLDALVKTKYETQFSKTAMIINVDKEFKKAVPMLKKSPYEYALSIGNKYDDSYFYYCKTKNEKYALISIPLFSKNPFDFAWDLLLKHKKMFEKICNQYEGNEQVLKFKDQAAKYAKKYIEKIISNEKSRYLNLLTHECTHLIDDLRKTKTFKTKEQKHDTIEDNKEYYNSPIEQNAYYQQTISIFDDWANQSVKYKQFNNFWDDFLRQYRGDWELLNDKNKRKLKKRAYAYWELYIKE